VGRRIQPQSRNHPSGLPVSRRSTRLFADLTNRLGEIITTERALMESAVSTSCTASVSDAAISGARVVPSNGAPIPAEATHGWHNQTSPLLTVSSQTSSPTTTSTQSTGTCSSPLDLLAGVSSTEHAKHQTPSTTKVRPQSIGAAIKNTTPSADAVSKTEGVSNRHVAAENQATGTSVDVHESQLQGAETLEQFETKSDDVPSPHLSSFRKATTTTTIIRHNTRHKEKRRPVGYVAPKTERTVKPKATPKPRRNRTLQRASGSFPRACFTHRPSLACLRSQSLTDYVRDVVLPTASAYEPSTDPDDDDDYDDFNRIHEYRPLEWTEGMAKITLPEGFCTLDGIARDRTGRGLDWQAGTPLGDYVIQTPIEQNIRGLAGVYEYTFADKPQVTIASFREQADAYRKVQVGSAVDDGENADSDEAMDKLARKFWQRLGPTMPPAWYGADQEGTLFGDDPASGWSIAKLDSCLHVLSNVPGVTTPYLYAGMWASVFCAHTEDMNLLSINYLHAGAPKIWYAVAPGKDADRFAELCAFQYSMEARKCKEFMRHKRCLLSPKVLQKAGIRYTTAVQRPGDAMITFPGGYHFGFNVGFNLAEATNFGVPEWIPLGLQAHVCLCRPDSVRIDVERLIALLKLYQQAEKREVGLSWKTWSQRREEKLARRALSERRRMSSPPSKKKKRSKAPRTTEFWVEVRRPISKEETAKKKGKRPLKKAKRTDEEIWHLAKATTRKGLVPDARVLCVLPAKVVLDRVKFHYRTTGDPDNQDEQCFAGQVVELIDDHVRVRLDGLPKSSDEWMHVWSPKLFLDGGRWGEDHDVTVEDEIGKTLYWEEVDSKSLCL
jgi:hypothetical protein